MDASLCPSVVTDTARGDRLCAAASDSVPGNRLCTAVTETTRGNSFVMDAIVYGGPSTAESDATRSNRTVIVDASSRSFFVEADAARGNSSCAAIVATARGYGLISVVMDAFDEAS